ncbi:MAG: tetratricopeptide repeat protein [Ignavibacteriales bacterium]|nr:tetratricopeptide repeat protein [Ignavibacteriales bacterium]
MKRTLIALFAFVAISAAGCSFSRDTAREQRAVQATRKINEQLKEARHEQALSRVIKASVYEVTGDFANAVLEYQEALQQEATAAIHFAISKDYSLLGKHALAAKHAKEAVGLDSSRILYRQNLASIYMNAYQPELAVPEFERIVQIDSNNTEAWFNLARLYQTSRPLRAIEIYERILDREGDDWEILLQTAEMYNVLGRFEQAAAKYRRMVELDPSNKVLQRQLAETYARGGKIQEATKILESILENDRNNAEAMAALADIYLDQRNFDEALVLYKKLMALEHTNPEVRLRVAVAYVGQAQRDSTFIEKAKPIFEQLKKEIPNDWRSYYYLGMIANQEKQDSLATQYFERVTRLAEWNGDAWWYIGTSYFEKGEYQKLVDEMQRAKRALPKDSRIYFLEGLGYSRLDRTDEAVKALKHSLDLKPDDINALSTLALTLDGLHRNSESDSLYERALRVDPQSHLILNNYGYSLAERGLQLDRALRMSLQAVAADSGNPSYLDTAGWVYFRLSKYDDARKYIEKAIAAGGASATVYEHMGDIQFKLGQKEKADEFWKQALNMNVNNQSLKDKIARGSI